MPASTSPRRGIERAPRRARRWPFYLGGLIVLAGAVIAVLPASLIERFLPAQVHAEDYSGNFLHGAAGKITVNGQDAGAIEWQIHPLALWRLALLTDIHWVKIGFVLDGTVELGRRSAMARDLRGGGPIENLRDLGVAAGWRGTAKVSVDEIQGDFSRLRSIQGRIEADNLSSDRIAEGTDIGNYVLQLAQGAVSPDGTLTASLSDAGGPLEVLAQIHFSPDTRSGIVSGTLKERPEASLGLRNQLNSLAQLKARDSAGRFPIELEFNF